MPTPLQLSAMVLLDATKPDDAGGLAANTRASACCAPWPSDPRARTCPACGVRRIAAYISGDALVGGVGRHHIRCVGHLDAALRHGRRRSILSRPAHPGLATSLRSGSSASATALVDAVRWPSSPRWCCQDAYLCLVLNSTRLKSSARAAQAKAVGMNETTRTSGLAVPVDISQAPRNSRLVFYVWPDLNGGTGWSPVDDGC